MNFMIFEGFLGSGKTLGASIFAKYYQERSGCVLYSNYGLKDSKPFRSLEDFKEIAKEKSSILVLDEAHMDLDARSFSSNHVKFFTQVSYYLRKLRCTLIMTSPSFSDLDSRIRNITNIYVSVTKDYSSFKYEMYDIQSKKYLKTMKINQADAFRVADRIFDTASMVTPVEIPAKKDDFTEFLNELKIISESYYKDGERVA